ncbi:ABC-2 family transporter protein [Planctomycetes bacterium Pla163]|uniref:ABC-2 family transporter protein n=1 Tax=Rohdeia mirabilis TaxID=2528008 RepID=A0A518D1M4_9BACT|nr:ABC-2 family transporter protein [Planctomycetes bacterium Pla163]
MTAVAKVSAVARRELGAAIDAPSAWVAAGAFAIALQGLFFFAGYPIGDLRFPGLWEGRVASLQVLFAWLPPLFAVLAPAFTMGSWAEERRAGTEELLLTWPIASWQVVLGKFLASWLLLMTAAVVGALPATLVVASLGPLDWGVAASGALGAALLGAGCVAVGLVVSAAAREQLVAFLVAALLLTGMWSIALFLRVVPGELAEWFYLVSPQAHFLDSAARGVFDTADLVYYGALVALALLVNWRMVEARRRG